MYVRGQVENFLKNVVTFALKVIKGHVFVLQLHTKKAIPPKLAEVGQQAACLCEEPWWTVGMGIFAPRETARAPLKVQTGMHVSLFT